MTKQDFMQQKPFVVSYIPGYDWVYTEHLYGSEVRISNGRHTQVVQIERITPDFFVIHCWLNYHTDGKIWFNKCELK